MDTYSVVEAPIKRSKAIKEKQASAGISDSILVYKKLALTDTLECVQTYQVAVNAAIEALAETLEASGFAAVIGDDQFSQMVEQSKIEKSNPFSASCQSSAHKQNLIDSGDVPAELWVLDATAVAVGKTDLSEGLVLK